MSLRSQCLALLITLAVSSAAAAQGDTESSSARRVDAVNYFLGTQTIGAKYSFTEKTTLVETAERIQQLGSNILKFSMSRRCFEDHYRLAKRDDIRSLVDLASKEPSVKAVLDMPFAYYHIWVYPLAHDDAAFVDGLSEKERKEAYDEIHSLASYLLKTYSGTGKTFYLGHWEGDWNLHPNYDAKQTPKPKAIESMIDWLNVRQRAIDDAKRQARVSDVDLYHYAEVCLAQKGMQGGKCMINDVLPHTNVDFVSYSSYDTITPHKGDTEKALHEALDYIESKLPPKKAIRGKRVFIGEYGFPLALAGTPQQQDLYARDVCRAALKWGCPFVLYWQMYCNENPAGRHLGFWLIDDSNRKQPFYLTLQRYHESLKQTASEFRTEHDRPPNDNELRKSALEILNRDGHRDK